MCHRGGEGRRARIIESNKQDLILLCFVPFPWSANKPENKLLICLIPQPVQGMVETGGLCLYFIEAAEKEMLRQKGDGWEGKGKKNGKKPLGLGAASWAVKCSIGGVLVPSRTSQFCPGECSGLIQGVPLELTVCASSGCSGPAE